MVCKNLEIFKGSSKTYELIVKRDGTIEDITDWVIYFTIKENMGDSDANAKLTKSVTSHTDALAGTTEIELTSSNTDIAVGNYYYSIDYKSDNDEIDILQHGKLNIRQPVLNTKS